MKPFALSITLPCLLAMSSHAQWRGSEQIKNTVRSTLTQVRAHPEAFRNVKVQFDVQFATLGNISNPFFTQFVPSEYANFHCWAAEQPIWRKQAFDDIFGLLFLSKSNPQLEELYRATTFARLRITALVRNTFQGQPWIEVVSYEPLNENVAWATLGHLYRADQWMEKRQWQNALSELSLASQAKNPNDLVLQIEKSMSVCYLRIGEVQTAVTHIQRARKLSGDTPDAELDILEQTANIDPTRELDRVVTNREVREFERPLWEAFEEDERRSETPATPAQPQR